MATLFGVCNSSPAQVLELLVKKKLLSSQEDISVIPYGTQLSEKAKKYKQYMFILNISDLLRNLTTLNLPSYANTVVILFASPLRLRELPNAICLDLAVDPAAKGFGYRLAHTIDISKFKLALRSKVRGQLEISRATTDHLSSLTEKVKQGSLLSSLMTFIYSLPSSTLQTPVKTAVATLIVKGLPVSTLEKLVAEASEYELTMTAKTKILEILESDVGSRYREAFKHYAKLSKDKGTAALASIATKYEVSTYELRYLLSVTDSPTSKVKAPVSKSPKAKTSKVKAPVSKSPKAKTSKKSK